MLSLEKRRSIDLLVEQFWKNGYLTLSRKFGTYLPEPSKVGSFDVDVVARYKKNYAIGITLTSDDLRQSDLLEKISFLASRQTRFTKQRVLLFIGVEAENTKRLKELIDCIDTPVKKNIRVFEITEKMLPPARGRKKQERNLFS